MICSCIWKVLTHDQQSLGMDDSSSNLHAHTVAAFTHVARHASRACGVTAVSGLHAFLCMQVGQVILTEPYQVSSQQILSGSAASGRGEAY